MHKILAVDDEIGISAILDKFLTKSGYNMIIANTGQDALDIMREDENIELIILDIKMPGLSGIDVLKGMKSLNKDILVIILSGSIGAQENVDAIRELGYDVNEILYKPIDLNELLERVKQKLPDN